MTDGFLYPCSAKELWDILKIGYGESNDVVMFDLNMEISYTKQSNLTVTQYITTLQKLWDELYSLRTFPKCKFEA